MADRPSKISVRNVSRTFVNPKGETFQALQNINVEIEDLTEGGKDVGEFRVVLGPSGCGKSTLLRIIAGLDQPTTGRVLLDGATVTGPGADRGMVFQSYTLFPWLTVKQNICFGLREKGRSAAEQERLAERFIGEVGLAGFENHYPKMLSGGMQQ